MPKRCSATSTVGFRWTLACALQRMTAQHWSACCATALARPLPWSTCAKRDAIWCTAAPNSTASLVIPVQQVTSEPAQTSTGVGVPGVAVPGNAAPAIPEPVAPPKRSPAHYLWAVLIARIYEVFPLLCPICCGQMRLIGGANVTRPMRVRLLQRL